MVFPFRDDDDDDDKRIALASISKTLKNISNPSVCFETHSSFVTGYLQHHLIRQSKGLLWKFHQYLA